MDESTNKKIGFYSNCWLFAIWFAVCNKGKLRISFHKKLPHMYAVKNNQTYEFVYTEQGRFYPLWYKGEILIGDCRRLQK